MCASTPSAALKPYDSDYTGYMGNYGNTMDRWCRRAAIVVWPRQHAFAARAEASPSWALTELRARLDAGDLASARAAAESLAPFWKAPGSGLLEPALHTAAGLEDPGIALILLRPFAVESVTPAHASGPAALAARYDESWHRILLDAWFGSRDTWRDTGDVDRKGWAGALPELAAALQNAGGAAAAGWLLAASGTGWMRTSGGGSATRTDHAAQAARGAGQAARRAAGKRTLETLARDCERRLTAITEGPARADDDWSVPWPGSCGCELCGTLSGFLADRVGRTLEWPLAEARRRHVKEQISVAELPVRHEIWKFGSPYTLVLTKIDELFRREARTREDAAASLPGWQPRQGKDRRSTRRGLA